jgi:transposase
VKDDRAASYQRTSASLHRVRGRLVAERTALINQLRALMLERGITVPQGRRKLKRILGIGVLTATALVAAVGNAQTFSCGRDLAAWLGLVPRQATTGGKPRPQRISKRGKVI